MEARHGFSFLELLVVLGILVILLGIFIPYASSKREAGPDGRSVQITWAESSTPCGTTCGQQQLSAACDPSECPGGRADLLESVTGPDDTNPFGPESSVKANDVTAALWLLVRQGYITDTKVFVFSLRRRRSG